MSEPLGPAPRRVPGAGQLLAGCVIEGELGRGGMGVVFRARDAEGRPVALKVLLDSSSGQRRERFRRELELTRELDHPGIVKVLGGGFEGQLPCIVLELIEGRDFEALLEDPGCDLDTKLKVVEDVARAVAYAHERGVIHRDLKPANVLVTQGGRARVTDFGLARDLDRETRLSRTGQGLGTPAYMAPEQARGEKSTGPATDVYALGVILFEALTGELPYGDVSTPMRLFDAILVERPRRPSELVPAARRYDALVARALEKDPHRRLSADEFAHELEALRLGLAPQRGGALPWVALAGALLAASAAAYLLRGPSSKDVSATPAPASSTASPTPDAQALLAALSERERALGPEEVLARLEQAGLREHEQAQAIRAHLAACDAAEAALARFERYAPADHERTSGWLDEAERALASAGERRTRSPRALLLRAKLEDFRLEGAAARRALEELLALPSSSRRDEAYRARLLLGELAAARGERGEAAAQFDAAILLRPDRPEARLLRLRQPDGDSADLERLQRSFPNDPGVCSLAASVRFGQAMQDRSLSPQERSRRFAEAADLLERGLQRAPDSPELLNALGFVLRERGEREAAGRRFRAALLAAKQGRGRVGYFYRVGHLARVRAETQGGRAAIPLAKRALQRARACEDANPAIVGELAILRWFERAPGGDAAAFAAIRKGLEGAIVLSPYDWEPHYYLGHTLRRTEATAPRAIAMFTRAIELDLDRAESHYGRGATHFSLKHYAEALRDAERAVQLKPNWAAARQLLLRAREAVAGNR